MKHACYGGTAALRTAASWVASGVRPGKKALVISADLSRPPHSGSLRLDQAVSTHSPEYILGGGAVAAIVGDEPAVLELELERAGYWTQEIADTFRPTSRDEEGDQIASLCAYLDALDGAYDHFEAVVGSIDYDAFFKKHIYHVPFPGMAREAHLALMGRSGLDKAALQQSFARKVESSLQLREADRDLVRSVDLHLPPRAAARRRGGRRRGSDLPLRLRIGLPGRALQRRRRPRGARARPRSRRRRAPRRAVPPLGRAVRPQREGARRDRRPPRFHPGSRGDGDLYEETYAGRGLLVLDRISGFRRESHGAEERAPRRTW